jgi:hypothetical protein
MTGEAQQSLHLARPVFLLAVFLLDFDERFQLAEMMRIAQRVKHAGLVHVFDRRLGHEAAHRCGKFLQARRASPAHALKRRAGDPDPEDSAHERDETFLHQRLLVQQLSRNCRLDQRMLV